jgi:hypothetical protein
MWAPPSNPSGSDFNCKELGEAKTKAEKFLRWLRIVQNVKNDPEFAEARLAGIEAAIKEGEGKVRRLPTQEELDLANGLSVPWDPATDEGWEAFPKALQQALQRLLLLEPVDTLHLETEIARYEEGLTKLRTEINKCPETPTLFASMTEEETADFSWKSTWTRLGDSDIYAAYYTDPQGKSFGYTINKVSMTAPGSFTAKRISSPDGNLCTYQGRIYLRTTVSGKYKCQMGGERPWRGTINW